MGIKAMALDKNKFGPLILITGELTHSFLCCIMRGLLKLISLIDIVNWYKNTNDYFVNLLLIYLYYKPSVIL